METVKNLEDGWYILQDVHDTGEELGLYTDREAFTEMGPQISEWEKLSGLKHLQLCLPASLISEGNSDILTRLPGGTGMNLTYQKEISRGFG